MSRENDQHRVSRHLLLSSPPGQFDVILGDINKINNLTPEFIQNVRSEYIKRNNLNLDTSASDETSSVNSGDANTPLYSSLLSSLKSYMDSAYANNRTKGVSCSFTCESSLEEGPGIFLLKTHVEKINLKNYHAGSWTATYSYNIDDGHLSGVASVYAHYFENGNVQLQSHKTFAPIQVKKGNDLAKGIITQVKQWEDSLMDELSEKYENMNDGILKSMRRVLPLSRVKMDWNLRAHRMAKTLNETKKSYA